MVRYILKKAKFFSLKKQNQQKLKEELSNFSAEEIMEEKISKSLDKNIKNLKQIFGNSHDFKTHKIKFGYEKKYSGALIYVDGLADTKLISNTILKSLLDWEDKQEKKITKKELIDIIKQEVLYSSDISEAKSYAEINKVCLGGNAVLILDGYSLALTLNATGWEKRSISEPQSETVVRGPREGFTESIKINASMIRRKIKSDKLKLEHMILGEKTRTDVYLMYLTDVAKADVVNQVRKRMQQIKVDAILESGYIEQYIEDWPYSPFATIGYTEKPDVAAAKILEGRVAIVVDGTPFVLTVPMLFIESFQTAEDYYSRPYQVSFNRIIRFIAYFLAIFMPGVYIALTAFHQELIPTTLLLTIADAREGTPFPVFFEALIMVFAFEVLKEAGIRLPRPVGQAISIVGALIMGDAAVSAGLVGAPMVITVALTAVASFLVPNQNDSATILRGLMMVFAAILGFYGIMMGALAMLIHLCSLTSFGVPFFDAFSYSRDLKDSIIRAPLWKMKRRPKDIVDEDETRVRMSKPPQTSEENRVEKEGDGGVADEGG